ncbi:hypothetical protein [Wolbachia endosymbiont of Chironomus riparius]|uniref:hypothetical protein n=1 Tax=Wolbachia endosymbiont of Chironomus riparius TaxID=2883238 RepID=UPI0020A1B8A5|nr:hypothetical protein [Wolbachia endosymbiont of Chironomus riparius]
MEVSNDTLITDFIYCQKKYNQQRKLSKTEEKLKKIKADFSSEHSEISLEKTEKVNYRNLCAHGTKGWALFSAFAFTGGQLLPGNEIKLNGLFASSGEARGNGQKGSNFVSTLQLTDFSANLSLTQKYSIGYKALNYENFTKRSLTEYNNVDKSLAVTEAVTELKKILKNPEMKKLYQELSSIPVIVIGDGIGKYDTFYKDIKSQELLDTIKKEGILSNSFSLEVIPKIASYEITLSGAGNEPGEVLYKRLNVRAIIVDKKNQNFIEKLILLANPQLAKTVTFLTTEEARDFEKGREFNEGKYARTFVIDFADYFKNKLTFQIASKMMKKVKIQEDFSYNHTICNETSEVYFPRFTAYHNENSDNIYYSKREKKTLNCKDSYAFLSSYSKCRNNLFFIIGYSNLIDSEDTEKLDNLYKDCDHNMRTTNSSELETAEEVNIREDNEKRIEKIKNDEYKEKIRKDKFYASPHYMMLKEKQNDIMIFGNEKRIEKIKNDEYKEKIRKDKFYASPHYMMLKEKQNDIMIFGTATGAIMLASVGLYLAYYIGAASLTSAILGIGVFVVFAVVGASLGAGVSRDINNCLEETVTEQYLENDDKTR